MHSSAEGNSDALDQLYEKLEWVFGQCSKYCMGSFCYEISVECLHEFGDCNGIKLVNSVHHAFRLTF